MKKTITIEEVITLIKGLQKEIKSMTLCGFKSGYLAKGDDLITILKDYERAKNRKAKNRVL